MSVLLSLCLSVIGFMAKCFNLFAIQYLFTTVVGIQIV